MRCVMCKQGVTAPGTATMTFEEDGAVIVIQHVPADVCQTCEAPYFDQGTTARLLALAEEIARSGIKVEVREYPGVTAAEHAS